MKIAWRVAAGHVLALLVALLIAAFAFLFRFNALGGSLGGFDNDDFFVLTRADLIVDGQRPLRDFAESELRGAWPSLTYALPAWAQMRWGRNLLVNAYLNVGALALCAGVVFLLARDLSRRWPIALLIAAIVIASGAKLYNYPKVLSLTVAVAALRWTLAMPTAVRLFVLAAWTVVAGLFRHDYGLYVGVAAVAGIVACEPRPWRVPARRMAIYVGVGLLLALPSIIWVEQQWGVVRYINEALMTVRAEGRRLVDWPPIDFADPLGDPTLMSVNYYAFWIIPAAGLAVLLFGPRPAAEQPASWQRGVGVALIAMTVLANYYFLRSNLSARLGDAIVPVALIAAWIAGRFRDVPSGGARVAGWLAPIAVLAVMFVAFVRVNSFLQEMHTGGITVSPEMTRLRFEENQRALAALPPQDWARQDTAGPLGVSRYLAECTRPDDHVLIGAYADPVPYFARRRFAGGQGVFAHGLYVSESDQRLALERLAIQSVPVVVTSAVSDQFTIDYPLVARHVAERYREVGVVNAYGQPYLRVFVEKTWAATGTDPILGFPCLR